MWPSRISNRSAKTLVLTLLLWPAIGNASNKPHHCPEDICIPGFVEAQGGSVEFLTQREAYDLGRLTCSVGDGEFSLTAFDPNTAPMVETSAYGASRTGISECQVKIPKGTTGIYVFQCELHTQFSNIDKDFKLWRHELAVTMVFPFLGQPYSFASISKLHRDSSDNLVKITEKVFDSQQLQCETEKVPQMTAGKVTVK